MANCEIKGAVNMLLHGSETNEALKFASRAILMLNESNLHFIRGRTLLNFCTQNMYTTRRMNPWKNVS